MTSSPAPPAASSAEVDRDTLHAWMNEELRVHEFRDWAPNGMQVEGRPTIRRLVTGVTANLDLIEHAVSVGADAVLVHHGMFWEKELRTITGWKRRRIGALLAADITLFAYHLPLDAHATLGNNAQLAQALGLTETVPFGGAPAIGRLGTAAPGVTLRGLADRLGMLTGQKPLMVMSRNGAEALVRRVAVVSGGGDSFHEEAAEWGADVLVSGEAAEASQALARELGCALLAGGHHATERFGARALGERIAERWGIDVEFHDVPNAV
jgi:dinuclear metal center YbgI/SA1388 family protein